MGWIWNIQIEESGRDKLTQLDWPHTEAGLKTTSARGVMGRRYLNIHTPYICRVQTSAEGHTQPTTFLWDPVPEWLMAATVQQSHWTWGRWWQSSPPRVAPVHLSISEGPFRAPWWNSAEKLNSIAGVGHFFMCLEQKGSAPIWQRLFYQW